MKINNFHAMGNGKTEYKFKENIRHITVKEPLTKIQKKKYQNPIVITLYQLI